MPYNYDTAQEVKPAVAIKTVELVGVFISTEDQSVTWKYKGYAADGTLVQEAEYTEDFAQISKEDSNYAKVKKAIRKHGYGHVEDAGFPTGGTVS